ncbi:MAG: hypothetical protein JNJ71_20225 [Rubrivivax sp.]|nr:hypothetical protein [Rubrivivax sp.]
MTAPRLRRLANKACWPMLAVLGMAAAASALAGEPFVPARDDQIVERLPVRSDAERRARQQQRATPADLPSALSQAREAVLRARRWGDPRELGAAQAVLAPWWQLPEPPAAVRLLRATVRQGLHQFEPAQADLQALIGTSGAAGTAATEGKRLAGWALRSPDVAVEQQVQAQARLSLAALHQLQGRFDAAAALCAELHQDRFRALGESLAIQAQACLAELQGLQGQPEAAERSLAALAVRAPGDAWLALLRAELAQRQGHAARAEAQFALAASAAPDVYTLSAWADHRLDQGRIREALAVLERAPEPAQAADALRLRRALAWHRLGDARAPALAADLERGFAAARQRGDVPHHREEARLALEVQGDASRAWELARENWQRQREPADALLLWRSGWAAGQGEAAQALLRHWADDPQKVDRRLSRPAGLMPAARVAGLSEPGRRVSPW